MAYIGKTPTVGNFVKLDTLTASATASYTMQVDSVNFSPESVNHMLVSLNGVIQAPTTSYTISGSTLTFASALTSSDSIDFIMVYGNVLDIGTPSDATVTNAKTNFVSTSSAAGLQIKGDNTTAGTLQLNCEQNSHGIKLKSPPHSASASYTLTFPNDDGDADQVLKTNGSGVLDWTTPSSGIFNQITSVTASGSTTVQTIDNCFTSTYRNYFITVEKLSISNSSSKLNWRFRTGGSSGANAGANMGGASQGWLGGSNSEMTLHHVNNATVHLTNNTYADDDFALQMWVFNPYANNERSIISGRSVYREGSTSYVGFNDFGMLSVSTETHTGFKLESSSAQFNSGGRITVYGITNPS